MSDSTPFIKKYCPKKPEDVVGQESGIAQLIQFINNYSSSSSSKKGKCILLHGPPGCGKTSAVHAIANQTDLELVEMNASDFRNKDGINSILGGAMKQMSLFSKGKLILVDEVDGLSGRKDRGGVVELLKLIADSSFPVICTAGDPSSDKLKALRKASTQVGFEEVSHTAIADLLTRVCTAENIGFDQMALNTLARMAGGDVRGALNDLQSLTIETKKLTKEALDDLSERQRVEPLNNGLLRVFKTNKVDIAVHAFDNVNEDLKEIMLWIDENLPSEYTNPADLARAYDYVSKADIMQKRIMRWQYWRFLVYVNAYLSAGVAVSKDTKNPNQVEYRRTMRLLRIWQANMKYAKRKSIAEKIAAVTHTSTKRAIKDTLPYLHNVFRNRSGAVMAEGLAAQLELDPDEVTWLRSH